jgi:fatty-acid desaturase
MRPPVFRIIVNDGDACAGRVVWAPTKSLWHAFLFISAVLLIPFVTTPSAVVVFLVLTYVTLLLGHSVGMHRKLIHRSFDCPKWLERTLVYMGVLVGMAGPLGILRIHDVRDWAQREPSCHDFFSHKRSLILDAFWQLNCRFEFDRPPTFSIEPEIETDRFYQFLEPTWMLHQVPVAVVLFLIGGWSWVVWGICVRVTVSVAGHWVVTYLTHNPGPSPWQVLDAGVQASNLNGYGLITMGECWHNNHHAFPESARIGLNQNEFDPGWLVISALQRVGLVTRIGEPRQASAREDLA